MNRAGWVACVDLRLLSQQRWEEKKLKKEMVMMLPTCAGALAVVVQTHTKHVDNARILGSSGFIIREEFNFAILLHQSEASKIHFWSHQTASIAYRMVRATLLIYYVVPLKPTQYHQSSV
jgi:hypothetical protein